MTTTTQKQKQLAEEILRKFGNPDYTEEELTEEIPIVAQLLADAQAEEREVLRKLAEKLQQASGHSTPFTEIDYIANQIIELLK